MTNEILNNEMTAELVDTRGEEKVITGKEDFSFISMDEVLGKDAKELTKLRRGTVYVAKLGGKVPVTALDNDEYKRIKNDCTFYETIKNRIIPKVDEERLMAEALVEAVHKDPRTDFTFKNAELLKKLGVVSAVAAAEKILAPGEIQHAGLVIQDISGFTDEAAKEREETVKNS